MTYHRCHNHKPFPAVTVVQDGWVNRSVLIPGRVDITTIRVPRMVEIPFKMSQGCHQWGELGAVTKGLMAPEGCDGCRWKPA